MARRWKQSSRKTQNRTTNAERDAESVPIFFKIAESAERAERAEREPPAKVVRGGGLMPVFDIRLSGFNYYVNTC